MVKSFQGVRKAPIKVTDQPILVKDYMSTHLITFNPADTIDHVITVLTRKRISGAPVVDESGKLVGMISEGDCLKEIIKGQYTNTPKFPAAVAEHMTTDVFTLPPDISIFDAADRFLTMKIRRFPVVKNDKLMGQISVSDIVRAMPKLKSSTW
jgi:CBS domain-containing protein